MDIKGTKHRDEISATDAIERIFAGRGDDKITAVTDADMKVNGGLGHDMFEFQLLLGQTFEITEVNNSKTLIEIFDDGGLVHTYTLIDVEQIDYWMVG